MGGVAALLVVMAWLTPDGFLLGSQLQSPDDQPPLPLEELVLAAAFLDIEPAFHRGAPYVVYLGHGASKSLWPRMRYAAAVFLADEGGFLPRHRLGLDVVEYWTHGLVLAWLTEQRRREAPYVRLADQRAKLVMPEVPPELRLQVYLEAVADFAAQAVSVAHEVDRTRRRWQQLGRDLCVLRQPEIPLMRHWRRLFEQASFRGLYPLEASQVGQGSSEWGDGARTTDRPDDVDEPRWATTRQGLGKADKDLVLRYLFSGRWQGDPEVDFVSLCDETQVRTTP